FTRRRQDEDSYRFRQLLFYLRRTLYVNFQDQVQSVGTRFVQPFLGRAVGMSAKDSRVFQKFAAGHHRFEFLFGDEIITLAPGLRRAARPRSARTGSHCAWHVQETLNQSGFPRARWAGHDQDQRGQRLLCVHSMFWTCSRNFSISALISRPMLVMVRASLSTPGVLESMVLASRCISCSRKSSFLPSSPAPSSNLLNCCRWLRRRSSSSLMSLRSASMA